MREVWIIEFLRQPYATFALNFPRFVPKIIKKLCLAMVNKKCLSGLGQCLMMEYVLLPPSREKPC